MTSMAGGAAPEADVAAVAVYRLDWRDCRSEPEPLAPGQDRERTEPLLRQNAVWFCRLRWIVVGVLCAGGVVGLFPRPLTAFGLAITPGWPLTLAAVLTISNVVFAKLARRAGEPGPGVSVRFLLWAQIVVDLSVLTAVIHWLGHGVPSAPFMYLFHIILACVVFAPGESLAVAGLAAVFYLLLLLAEWAGLVQPASVLVVGSGAGERTPEASPAAIDVVSMLLVWAVIWYLVSWLADALHARERELFIANRRLKASIEERSKHMLQTTHQLKAPFAAVHAQSQLLLGDYCGALPTEARVVAEKIAARCQALAHQIQDMLQLANLRSQGQTSPPKTRIDLAGLVEDALARVEPEARRRGIRFEKSVEPVMVHAVQDHLTMLLDNLVVNAVHYSHDRGTVQVSCRGHAGGEAELVVRDRGIGIPKEKLPRIFDDYYRTEEAVHHNSASTGLGLAIVRQVACEDRVPVQVESAPGWGTRFTVTLPRADVPLENESKSTET